MASERVTGSRKAVYVREVMTASPITVQAGSTVTDALALLDRHSLEMLPVVSPAGRIVGVVTEAELLREAVRPYRHRPQVPPSEGRQRLPPRRRSR